MQAELYRHTDEGNDDPAVPVRLVFVRKHGNKKQYLVLLSTDTSLSEEEIIRVYGKRWGIETLFQLCKSTLLLSKESRGIPYDAMCVYTAIVFSRYLMLAWERRVNCDDRTAGEIFYKLTEEMADITWVKPGNSYCLFSTTSKNSGTH